MSNSLKGLLSSQHHQMLVPWHSAVLTAMLTMVHHRPLPLTLSDDFITGIWGVYPPPRMPPLPQEIKALLRDSSLWSLNKVLLRPYSLCGGGMGEVPLDSRSKRWKIAIKTFMPHIPTVAPRTSVSRSSRFPLDKGVGKIAQQNPFWMPWFSGWNMSLSALVGKCCMNKNNAIKSQGCFSIKNSQPEKWWFIKEMLNC